MNTPFFIARRISSLSRDSFSRPIVRIAIIGIALALSVMIIAVAVVQGFQQQISDKVIGFGGHIQINKYDFNSSYETRPISSKQTFYPGITELSGVKHIQIYAYKAAIIKTFTEIQGVVLKGVGEDYDWAFFKQNLIEGKLPDLKNDKASLDILLSSSMAEQLELKTGDDLRMYFIAQDQQNMRGRKFTICGIYKTGLEEFDKQFVIGDIAQIRKLNRWSEDQVGGFEILLDDLDGLEKLQGAIYQQIGYDLNTLTIKESYPQIFDWLKLMDMNVIIILSLMIMVAGITMISILLILILERTSMIGILKALGSDNALIRKVFLYKSLSIVGRGLLWGNVAGIAFCILQLNFGMIKLDQESYYMSVVPILLKPLNIVLINFGTALVSMLILVIPSMIIGRIQPVKAIQFD